MKNWSKEKQTYNGYFHPFFGFVGFFGFFGFLYFVDKDPTFLVLFVLFSFFSEFLNAKFRNVKQDERFQQNRIRAFYMSARISLSVAFSAFMILELLIDQLFSIDIASKYAIVVALLSCSFALVFIMEPILLDRYETK